MLSYTLKIISKIKETEDAYTFGFKQPALKKIKYLPGQYLTLILNINGRRYRRPYSLSSALETDTTLNITVKRVPHGIVSNHLIDVVKEGDLIEVMEPLGDFTYNPLNCYGSNIFLWGAGSGITPLFSIAKSALKNNNQIVHLYYSNGTQEEVIFYEELLKLEDSYPNRFFVNYFLTKEVKEKFRYGRICEKDIIETLSLQKESIEAAHYICGPHGLKETLKTALSNFQSEGLKIYSEDFEHIIDKKEFAGIETRYVMVEKDGNAINLEVVRGRSILEACLDIDIDLPYSCQTGNCTLCKALLVSGDVKVITSENPLSIIAENERLLCCSYPLTADVKFQISNTI